MATDGNGIDFRLTWNPTHLFVGWDGTDWKSTDEGADLFVYLNTSEGSVLARDWVLLTRSPLPPTTAGPRGRHHPHVAHDGSAWTDQSPRWNLRRMVWQSGHRVVAPSTALGQPTGFDIVVTPSGRMAGTFGPLSPCKTLRATTERTFTHAWHAENISNVTSPQQFHHRVRRR